MKRIYKFSMNRTSYIFDGENVVLSKKESNENGRFISKDTIFYPRSDNLQTICLILNNSCNLNCSYCFANKGKFDKPYEQMKLDDAKKAIVMVVNNLRRNKKRKMTIAFFGGEPLLSFEMIKNIVSFVKENFNDIQPLYRITTNGTLLTSSIVSYLENNPFEIMISIDGSKKQHDFFRKDIKGNGSYDKIKNNLKFFKDASKLNARITITQANSNISDYLYDILSLGFRKITFAVDYSIPEIDFFNFKKSLKKMFKLYLQDIKKGFYYDITNITTVISSIILHYKLKSHCNAGISYITLSADGVYYRCPRFVSNKLFKLATLSEKPDILLRSLQDYKDKLKNDAADRNKKCSVCPFVYLCGGTCPHHAYMHAQNEFSSVKLDCEQKILIYKETLKLICSLSIEERKRFLLFLTSLWKRR